MPRVRKDRDHDRARRRGPHGARDQNGRRRGHAHLEPFVPGETGAHLLGRLRLEPDRPVDHARVVRRRADRGRQVFQALETVHRTGRFDADDLDRGLLLLEEPSRPRDRSSGSDPGHEVGDPALGLPPDLRAGRSVVRVRVRRIVVLVGIEVAEWLLPGAPPGLPLRAVGPFERIGEDDAGTERLDPLDPGRVRVPRQHELDRKPEPGTEHGVGHGRVAARRIDERAGRVEPALLDRALDDAERRPVLHGTGRVAELGLPPELEPSSEEVGDPFQRDERGSSDRAQERVVHPDERARGSERAGRGGREGAGIGSRHSVRPEAPGTREPWPPYSA